MTADQSTSNAGHSAQPAAPTTPTPGSRSSLGLSSPPQASKALLNTSTTSTTSTMGTMDNIQEANPSDSAEPFDTETLGESGGGSRRRRASRRQSEDTMRAMRSLDRQYGRRRRLNSVNADQPLPNAPTALAAVLAGGRSGAARVPMRRGDSRALFAPAIATATEVVSASQAAPTLHSPAGSVVAAGAGGSAGAGSTSGAGAGGPGGALAGSARLARQLMLMAGRLPPVPPQGQQGQMHAAHGVRPRASMPQINGARRPPQRTRSQATRSTRDELSDALTMKSVEIRGGRIVLDDPSSSGSGSSSDEDERMAGAGRPYARLHRPSVGSVGSVGSARSAAAGQDPAQDGEAAYWEEALRRRWYARRCLASGQPFASAHRLAQAEHAADAAFPLLNDLRRVVHETRAAVEAPGRPPVPHVAVLLCTDAVVLSAPGQPLRAVELDDVRVVAGDDHVVDLADGSDGAVVRLRFAGGARAWAVLAVETQRRLGAVLQDLRLDEEDFVDRPPRPLLLSRGRSSIAGAQPGAAHALGTPQRSRNSAQGGVYWVPDAETAVCMVCQKTAFSMMVRRHHCRACGLVICYRCSKVDRDRHRTCVRCSGGVAGARRTGSLGAVCLSAGGPQQLNGGLAPKTSPSLHTLGRRAAEYLPAGEVVMQIAAQRGAAGGGGGGGGGGGSAAAAAADMDVGGAFAQMAVASEAGPADGFAQMPVETGRPARVVRDQQSRLARRPLSALFPH
ncbi:hypothetical protein LPJ66_007868 [Kickxella alabastrina]|uniref:Uncharacterized protein n=1 Tax=Kickxella alabastrina TaxID=61397 RepID=A0ACC1IBH1_9FUNG|nr:hypothetical protein LPJ66_007868 [Kickxella alabastrina]